MTDTTHSPAPAGPPEPWQVEAENRARLAAEARTINRATIFAVLADAGITTVTIHFDGYGDSGQIEDVTVLTGDMPTALPSCNIEMAKPTWDGSSMGHHQMSVRQAIESLVYEYLELTHYGWEVGDGGYGEFTFDVAEGLVSLDYDERRVAIDNYQHEF